MPVGRTLIGGSPYLGVYLRMGERLALLPPSASKELEREIERLFGVTGVRTTVHESEILGALVALNSFGVLVGGTLDEAERAALERVAPVGDVPGRLNALGNNVLANDVGAVVHPDFSDEALERIARTLKVPACRGTVAGLGTVGMAASATNRGVVVHPRTTEREAELLTATLKAPVHRSTANFGIPVVGACVVANTRAALVGRPTTTVEIVHLQEGFGIFD